MYTWLTLMFYPFVSDLCAVKTKNFYFLFTYQCSFVPRSHSNYTNDEHLYSTLTANQSRLVLSFEHVTCVITEIDSVYKNVVGV